MWAVAYVDARRELKFTEWLDERGVRTFLPVAKKLVKPKHKHKPVMVTSPLFLHYVFTDIEDDKQWSIIKRAPMFYYFVSINKLPIIIDKNSIFELMRLQQDGKFDDAPIDDKLKIFEGVFVQIEGGSFIGRRGVVIENPGPGAANVLLDVQGLKVKIGLSLLGRIV